MFESQPYVVFLGTPRVPIPRGTGNGQSVVFVFYAFIPIIIIISSHHDLVPTLYSPEDYLFSVNDFALCLGPALFA